MKGKKPTLHLAQFSGPAQSPSRGVESANNLARVVTCVVSEAFSAQKKPVNHLGITGSETGGMDGTRTRDLLRDRQTL